MSAPNPLSGVRVGLSGSIPPEMPPEEQDRIRSFVKALATRAFRDGPTLVHGCHPTIVRPLLEAAAEYREARRSKARLVFVGSAVYDKGDGIYAEVPRADL